MIKFIKIPKDMSRSVLLTETAKYLEESDTPLTPEVMLDADLSIPNLDYYHIYIGGRNIGFGVGFPQDEYWFAHRVWLAGRAKIYFKQVIEAMRELKTEEGYKGIIAHPDSKTASLYKKHNIMKEM